MLWRFLFFVLGYLPASPRKQGISGQAPLEPLSIKGFQIGTSETLINKGLTGRGAGEALNTRASGHLFLEMRLRFFYLFSLS